MTAPPQMRARAPLSPSGRWALRGLLLAAIVLAPYLVTYNQPAPELGLTGLGGLKPCPQSPNCVCTEWRYLLAYGAASDRTTDRDVPRHYAPPIELPDDSSTEWTELTEIVRQQPGVKILESTDRYLRAERSTTIYGLIDDFELSRLYNGTVLIRSAARLAYADFGRNRRFVETIRMQFENREKAQWF